MGTTAAKSMPTVAVPYLKCICKQAEFFLSSEHLIATEEQQQRAIPVTGVVVPVAFELLAGVYGSINVNCVEQTKQKSRGALLG